MFTPPTTRADSPTRPRRWGVRLLAAFSVLILLLWGAPIIAGWTPLLGWLGGQAEGYLDGSVRVGNVSLGWFSPVILYNVEVRDADGTLISQIPKIEGDRSLLWLALDRSDLGSFRLQAPKIDVTFTGQESNLERLLAKTLRTPTQAPAENGAPAEPLPKVQLEMVDAQVTIHDADTGRVWVVPAMSMSATIANDAERTLEIHVQGTLREGAETGSLNLDASLRSWGPHGAATIKGKFSALPLGIADVLLRRVQPGARFHGSLSGAGSVVAHLKAGTPYVEMKGELMGNHIFLFAPFLAEPLHLQRIALPYSLRLDDQTLFVERAEMSCDLGNLALHGSVDFAHDWRAALEQSDFGFSADVNLAALADRLPKTLHVHADLQLTAATLHAECQSQASPGGLIWRGKINTSDVRGFKGAQRISWTEPITLLFQARGLTQGLPIIEQLKCTSRFLRVEGAHWPDRFTLNVEADLERLAEPLGQIIDLEGFRLAGKAKADLTVQRRPDNCFDAAGNAQLTQINVTGLTAQPWQEERGTIQLAAAGQIGKNGTQRIESTEISVNLGTDSIVVQSAEPIADLAHGPWGACSVRVNGDLARWRQRVCSAVHLLDDWQLDGQANLQMQIRPTPQAIECAAFDFRATKVRIASAGLCIQEPTLNVQTAGLRHARTGCIELSKTKLACPTLQLDAEQLSLDPATMAIRGELNVTGDVARLFQWTQEPNAPLDGTVAGRIGLQSAGARRVTDFNLSLKNSVRGPLADRNRPETEVKCVGRAVYDPTEDAFVLEKIEILGAALHAEARGKIAKLRTAREIDLTGAITYDLEKLEPQLRPWLGNEVKFSGQDTLAFRLTGPLFPAVKGSVGGGSTPRFTELNGEASLGWKALSAHGCDVGPAQVKGILQHGWLQFYPIEATLNGGRMRVQPNLRLDPEPPELILLKGPTLRKAQLTPALCSGALGYALPMLANAAEAEGEISVLLDGGRIPLAAPTSGELKGTLLIHSARFGPSPLLRELTSLLKMPPPTGIVKESKVPFQMIGGKVYHQDLELTFPEFSLKSSGAVGLDGSLALVIETQIPASVAAAARLTASQAKQIIRIPIGGTFAQPRPDPRALESITSALGRSILQNELEKLFQPKR